MRKVSVVVPVYNDEKYLRACLKSLADQTLDDIEVIVVNDGSTDNSLAIAQEFAREYSCFSVYSTENKGSGHARNYGAERSQGEYLAFVDGDDEVEPDYCKAMYEKAVRDGNDVVMCRADHIIQRDGQIQSITYPDTFWEEDNFKLAEHPYLFVRMSTGPWNKLVNRDLFFKVKFPEELRCRVDHPFVAETFCLAENIGIVKRILYHYFHTHGGMSFQKFSMVKLDIINSAKCNCSFMESNDLVDIFQDELEWFTLHSIHCLNPDLVRKDASSWDARMRYVQEMYLFIQNTYPHWRKNPYYISVVRESARHFRPFHYKYYRRAHMVFLVYLSRFLPGGIHKHVLRADHVLVFVCRYIRWVLLENIGKKR